MLLGVKYYFVLLEMSVIFKCVVSGAESQIACHYNLVTLDC